MPYGDRTGPVGIGPRTGRGLGFCTGFENPGFMRGPGMGMGMGRGQGRGYGRGFGRGPGMGYRRGFGRGFGYFDEPSYHGPASQPYEEPTKEEESTYLKRVAESLEKELNAVRDRLKELTKKE